jgi:hypothetical protein
MDGGLSELEPCGSQSATLRYEKNPKWFQNCAGLPHSETACCARGSAQLLKVLSFDMVRGKSGLSSGCVA